MLRRKGGVAIESFREPTAKYLLDSLEDVRWSCLLGYLVDERHKRFG